MCEQLKCMMMFFVVIDKNSLPGEIMRERFLSTKPTSSCLGASDSNYSYKCCLLVEVKGSFVTMSDPQSSKEHWNWALDGETAYILLTLIWHFHKRFFFWMDGSY